jgi:hypothetical protein
MEDKYTNITENSEAKKGKLHKMHSQFQDRFCESFTVLILQLDEALIDGHTYLNSLQVLSADLWHLHFPWKVVNGGEGSEQST